MEYTLTRSKRKTAAIYVRNGSVEVRAPLKMPKRDIDRFVASKQKWIEDKLAKSVERTEQREAFELTYGDFITLRGVKYPVAERAGNRAGYDGECFYMPPGLEPDEIKSICVQIYRRLAKMYLPGRTAEYAGKMGTAPASVRVNSAKTRWGSCSAKKSVNFSWLLIMADDEVIDYVVVHELAHLTEMNHSPRFWSVVECVLPDYRERREQLRALQKRLAVENWGK